MSSSVRFLRHDAGVHGGSRSSSHTATNHLSIQALAALLGHGANINPRNSFRQMPLHYARRRYDYQEAGDVVDQLLRSRAGETLVDDNNCKPADRARIGANMRCMKELLTSAPAGRAWRHRGYVVLCPAHRTQCSRDRTSTAQSTRALHGRLESLLSWRGGRGVASIRRRRRVAAPWRKGMAPTGSEWWRGCYGGSLKEERAYDRWVSMKPVREGSVLCGMDSSAAV